MTKALVIDYEKCTGCRLCEMVCSVKHEGVVNPARTRISIAKWETKGLMVPMVCKQCEDAPCVAACPTNARFRDEELGRVIVNYDRCIGCKTCMVACPFGAVNFDPVAKKIISCDLCDGEPQCARFCETGAIRYMETGTANKQHQREAAERFLESMQKAAIESAR